MEGENEHATACAKPTAQANGVVASTTMIKLITNAKTSELCASTSKQSPLVATKLTGWLRDHIAASHIAGLEWIDEEAQMFKIPWKRASDRNFDGDEDSLLFWNYALYSGKNPFEGDLASHKKRLSDALFCNQDILEHKDLRVNNGASPYRVFQFVQQKRRRRRGSSLGRKHKKKPFLLKKYKIGQGSSSINHMSGRKKAVSHGAAKPATPEADCGSRVDYHPLMKLKYSYVRQAGDTCEQMMDLRGSMKGPPLLKCFFCARKLENNVQLMEHYEAHIARNQSFVSEIEDLTVCRRCCISLDTPHDLQTHLNEVHQLTASTSCLICLRNLGSEAGLLVHMKQTHVSGETPYTCEVCRFRTSQYRDLTAHYRQVHTRGQYVLCPYCLRAFRSNTNNAHYIIHLRKHLNKGVKPCDSCSLVFVSAADLISHRATCHGVASVTTDKTGETTVEVVELCLNHNAEKKGSNQNGDDGMLTCLNVLPPRKDYVGLRLFIPTDICCIECDYPMSRMNHFIKHMMCPICRYGTNCSTAFAEHVLMSHGNKRTASDQRLLEKEWACACGFTTNLGNALASHLMECGSGTAYRGQKLRRYVTRAYPGNPDGIFRKSLSLLASRDPAGAAIVTDAEGDATDGESRRIESVTDGYLAVVAGWRDRHSAGKQCRAMSHDPAPSAARQTDSRSFKRRRIRRLWSPRETRECAADDETHMRCENDAEHPDARPPLITADPAGGAIADRAINSNHPRVNLPASLLHASAAGGASADSPRFRGCCSANAAVRHDKCDFLSRVRLCSLPGVVSPARRPRGGEAWGGHPRKRVGVHRQPQGSEEEGEEEGEGSCTDRWQTTRRHVGCVPAPLWGDAIKNIELGGGGGVAGGATVLPYPEEELQLHARLAAVCYEAASGGARERGDAASGGARERGDAASGGARERGDGSKRRSRGAMATGSSARPGPQWKRVRSTRCDRVEAVGSPNAATSDLIGQFPRLGVAAAAGDDDRRTRWRLHDDGSEAACRLLVPHDVTTTHPDDDDDAYGIAQIPRPAGAAAMEEVGGKKQEEKEKKKRRR
ncbi:PREDICTED: uncharacterized protein LOC106809574 [Priapulus caudatus]|uniref:Uncharacterized protein LOC106809574 n=1 Tax=Priapulus caudatus TaxID=37621 RepID=A0ABM1E7L7_PRICU|nr:PREDICTED: uncharacterized protein LOC106809574 [Priapulus caudatus]